MRVQRFNLIPDKLEYKVKSLENIKNKIIDFFCLDSSIEINYSIINDYEMSISIKKSVKKEIPVLYQFNEKYIKNDNTLDESTRSGKLSFLSDCYSKRYNNSLDEVVKLAEQSYN